MTRYYKIRCELVFHTQDDVDYADMLVSATHEMERLDGNASDPYSGTLIDLECTTLNKNEYFKEINPPQEEDY